MGEMEQLRKEAESLKDQITVSRLEQILENVSISAINISDNVTAFHFS